MSFNRHACRFLLAGPQAGEVNQLRISDDIRQSALPRFRITRVYRRYVGLPPGPLEARKRATKRRLVGLSSENAATAGENAPQAGLNSWLFGTKRAAPHSYQWQEPSLSRLSAKPTENKGTYPSCYLLTSLLIEDIGPLGLPPWPSDGDSILDPCPLSYSGNVRPSITKAPIKTKAEYRELQPNATPPAPLNVEHCKPIGGKSEPTRRNVRRLQHRSLPLQRLLAIGTPMKTVLEYFKGPILDAQKLKYLERLLSYQTHQRPPKPDEAETLSNWIQTQIVLGTLPFQHIAPLLEIVKKTSNNTQGALSVEIFYARVVESVQRCKKSDLRSSKAKLFKTVLQHISSTDMSPGLESLGWRIVEAMFASRCGLRDEGIDVFVSNAILAERVNHNPTPSLLSNHKSILRALRFFQPFPNPAGTALVESVSKAFIAQIQASHQIEVEDDNGIPTRRKTFLNQLSIWWSSLQDYGLLSQLQEQPSWEDLEHVIGSGAPDLIATYLRPMDQKSRCFFLIRHCYEVQPLSTSELRPPQPVDLRAILEAQFRDLCEEYPDRSPFVNLLLTVRLEKERGVHNDAVHRVFSIIRSLGMSGTILTLTRYSNVHHLLLEKRLAVEEINYYIEQGQPRIAYRIFQLFPKLPLEMVPALAEVVLNNQDLSTDTALHYRHRRQSSLSQTKPLRTNTEYLIQPRTQLLNSMAYAYSRSPHDPSISFRKVKQCYLALKTERLPITADITSALSYAGIVRYLQAGKWVSTGQYNYILSLVREVEGQQVADRLEDLVASWRGKVLKGKLCRGREERAFGSLRSSALSEEQSRKEQQVQNKVPPKLGKDRLHWYQQKPALQCDS